MTAMRCLLVALLVPAWPGPASAFECTLATNTEEPFVSIHWAIRTVPYALRSPGSSSLSTDTTQRIVQQSFGHWEEPRCSDIAFDYRGIVEPSVEPREVSQVVFIDAGWMDRGRAPEAVGLTTMTYGTQDGEIKFGVVELNEDLFSFADANEGCSNGAYDLGAVVTHEAGHFIGLAHTREVPDGDQRAPTMTAVVGSCDAEFQSLETDDIEGLCFIYPAGGAARVCATLPQQDTPYVQGVPFGCTTSRSGSSSTPLGLVVALAILLCCRACSPPRSAR